VDAHVRETQDLPFAAFCHLNGLPIVDAREWRGAGGGVTYAFAFADLPSPAHPAGRWDILALEFANSEAQRFDQAVLALKQLCRRRGRR
jgi:hypothetical protein